MCRVLSIQINSDAISMSIGTSFFLWKVRVLPMQNLDKLIFRVIILIIPPKNCVVDVFQSIKRLA